MTIFVVFATRNGMATLPRLFEALDALDAPDAPLEVVAVDNGSTDGSGAWLAAATPLFPKRVLCEPRPGKNAALNTALLTLRPRLADDDLVVLTDDDVAPDPGWLCAMERAAATQPSFDIFGGAIVPAWPSDPPRWLLEWKVPLGVAYAATTAATGPIGADCIWGPNMMVRGRVVRAGHAFDETTGPDGTAIYGMGSETELTVRLERAGYRAYFVAEARVHHQVRLEQIDEAWLYQRGFRHGAGFARYHDIDAGGGRRWAGLPRGLALRLTAYRAMATMARRLPPSRTRFQILWQERWLQGLASSYRKRTPTAPGAPTAAVEALKSATAASPFSDSRKP